MNYYELTCLIPPAASEKDAQEVAQKIKEFIQEESGVLEKMILPIKKSLIHFVKKQEEIYLITAKFRLAPEKIENLTKKLKYENQVIRYMLLNKKPIKENRKIKHPFLQEAAASSKSSQTISKTKNKKVELKEIDKKIDEILKTNK